MSRTYRDERLKKRNHERGTCPWCQGDLSHKHKRHEAPLFEEKEDEEEFEPDRVIEWDD